MGNRHRKMHLNIFVMGTGHHEAAWRHPDTHPEQVLDIQYYAKIAKIAEAAKLDSLFFGDILALSTDFRYNTVQGFDPVTLLSALAVVTERIGLIATASTTYNEPFHLARRFASLDHISRGRAGWNVVTSGSHVQATNFNVDKHPPAKERYERAKEVVDLVKKLWDSWEDDAILNNKVTGQFASADKIHPVNHKGAYYKVKGPLTIARSPQGYPLLVQAGSSEEGKEFAAQIAEAVFTAQQTFEDARSFYSDVKSRLSKYGRKPDELKILPGFCPIVGRTEKEAKEKEAELNQLLNPAYGIHQLSSMLNFDLSGYPLDERLPEIPLLEEVDGVKSRFQLVLDLARRENLTIRQILERLAGGRGHRVFSGTPVQIADQLEEWFVKGAADGFNIMPPYLPKGFEDFTQLVVPELQKRGLFRTEYTGATLRDHYELARPTNQFARESFLQN